MQAWAILLRKIWHNLEDQTLNPDPFEFTKLSQLRKK